MDKVERFSKRFGHSASEKEIIVREDAPNGLREYIPQLVYELKYQPSFIRAVACRVLKIAPDRGNWSEFPNIDFEVNELLLSCDWYRVYDIIEALYEKMESENQQYFESEINDYFKINGIGWKLEKGLIETRGNEEFEESLRVVEEVLDSANLPTARTEIKEAIYDLSRRPHPDITGAIQHSLACLECVCRQVAGDEKATLGDLIKKYPDIVPRPLDQAIAKIWGFTSEQGRHLREGQAPEYLEAELVVGVTASISTYLGKKLGGEVKDANAQTDTDDELPF